MANCCASSCGCGCLTALLVFVLMLLLAGRDDSDVEKAAIVTFLMDDP
ncbi:MAG: hypothetical protein AB7Y46_00305 [Armatimonadota bacterium]